MGKKMDLDSRRRYRLDKYASEFNRRVDTMDVVDALGPLLPESARQAIQCALDRKGTISGNRELSKRVRSRDGWFEKLIFALQKCEGLDDLVEKLITDQKGSLMPKYVKMKSGSPEIDVRSSFGVTRPIAQTPLPNEEQALEEQATKLTKYNTSAHTISDSSITELASARNYQGTRTLQNTTSHSKIIYQDRCEDVTQPSSYKYRLTQTFPNKEQALEEQITQLKKCATTSQTRSGTSEELTSARTYQEKGTQENTTSGKDRKEVKSQIDDEIQSCHRKEELSREQGNSEAVDSKSQKVCKESITSSIDEKEKDESAVFLEPAVTADEPQQIDKSKDLGVINEAKKQNPSPNLINADSASPVPAYSKFAGRDVDPKIALENMSKGCDLSQGACQNGQRSYETTGRRGDIHERSTMCVSNECIGQKGADVEREVKDLCQVDPVLNRAEIITGDALKSDDDTELRFFHKDNDVKEQKNFSKAGEDEKVIFKDLHVLTPTGERNPTKIKELRKISEADNSRNSYQPLKSNDSPLSHNPPSSQEFSPLVSDPSEGEAFYTYPPNSKIIVSKNEHAFLDSSVVESKIVVSGEETSQTQNNAEFTVQNQTIFRKGTEALEDSHSVARNGDCVESTLVGHEQPVPFKDANERFVNDDNVIAELPVVREEDAEDDLGCQNLIDSTLTKAGGCKGGGNETETIKWETEAPPVVKELGNEKNEMSNDNLRYNEIKEMRSVGIDEIRVKQKDVESVNDKEGVSNDAMSYKHDNENDSRTEVISWNPTEQQESVLHPGREIPYINDNNVNGSNTNMESRLEDENREGSATQQSNGIIGKTVNLIGSMAAMMFGSQT